MSKEGMDYLVEFKSGNDPWSQMRIAHLHSEDDVVQSGVCACSPVGTDHVAEFDFLEIA
ncbi:MAG: DUF1349 domain-containing protein [Chloroflexi bacterium]|nr:DUF1349 domain-containing protein [Chloroflexota bacterium]